MEEKDMPMTSRERMLTALSNGRPDRLPCQVHGWMDYYLKNYLGTMDWIEANDRFGFDHALYVSPDYIYSDQDLKNWVTSTQELGMLADGYFHTVETIETPDGILSVHRAQSDITLWDIQPLIKNWDEFRIWAKWRPIPIRADFTRMNETRARLGDKGIIRSHPFSAGQGSPWQSLCVLMGTAESIYAAIDEPDMTHEALRIILEQTLKATELWKGIPADMVEVGGGAGSNTVISPNMYQEFCLPYDIQQNEAFHACGLKVVTHLCGGLMQQLDHVAKSGTDGLETMTPKSMGGDCDLAEASRLVGKKLFLIGGFDQNAGFEKGTPDVARRLVFECFEATKEQAGYIIAPSDHFFKGDLLNLQAFCDAVKECTY
jgi:uroporphyrinogen decarboxylase